MVANKGKMNFKPRIKLNYSTYNEGDLSIVEIFTPQFYYMVFI